MSVAANNSSDIGIHFDLATVSGTFFLLFFGGARQFRCILFLVIIINDFIITCHYRITCSKKDSGASE